MTPPVDLFQFPNIQMAVNSRCCNICVSEQLLDISKVAVILKQVSCEAMPEQVRVNSFVESGQAAKLFNQLPDSNVGQRLAAPSG